MVDYYAKIRGATRKYAYNLSLKYLYLAFQFIFSAIIFNILGLLTPIWNYQIFYRK